MRPNKVRCINPRIGEEPIFSYRRVQLLVHRGVAAIIPDPLNDSIITFRYLESYEVTRLREDIEQATEDYQFDRDTDPEAQKRVWKTKHSGRRPIAGGPESRVRQFVPIRPRGIGVEISDKMENLMNAIQENSVQ